MRLLDLLHFSTVYWSVHDTVEFIYIMEFHDKDLTVSVNLVQLYIEQNVPFLGTYVHLSVEVL